MAEGKPPVRWGALLLVAIPVLIGVQFAVRDAVERKDRARFEAQARTELDTVRFIGCVDLFRMRPGQLVVLETRVRAITGYACNDSLPVDYESGSVPRYIRESYDGTAIALLRGRLRYVGDRLTLTEATSLIDGG